MKAPLLLAMAGCLSLSTPATADSGTGVPPAAALAATTPVDRRVWRGEPIGVRLQIDAERIVHFPDAGGVRAGLIGGPVPGLQIQPLGNRLYLRARQPFARTRLLAQTGRGQSLLLDLSVKADAAADPGTLEILTAATPAPADPPGAALIPARRAADRPLRDVTGAEPVGYVALVRHAAQTLYAPERLIPPEGSILRVPLHSRQAPHLVRGGQIEATPLAAWRAAGPRGPLWVTAVRLRNRRAAGVDLDPRDLRGIWRASAFQHGHLGPAGLETDVTAVYLVSDRPFDEALGAIATAVAGKAAP